MQENGPKRIIQLLGYPGVGKETIARILSGETGMELRHSEGYNAEAFKKHGIGDTKDPTPEALAEAAQARRDDFARLNALPEAKFPSLVFTNKFRDGIDVEVAHFGDVVDLSRKQEVPLIAIRLHCDDAELKARASSQERKDKNKLTNPRRIDTIKENPLLTPSPDEAKVVDMDVTHLTAMQSAICVHLTSQLLLRGDMAHVPPQKVADATVKAINVKVNGEAAFKKWPEPGSLKLLEEGLASVIRTQSPEQRLAQGGRGR